MEFEEKLDAIWERISSKDFRRRSDCTHVLRRKLARERSNFRSAQRQIRARTQKPMLLRPDGSEQFLFAG